MIDKFLSSVKSDLGNQLAGSTDLDKGKLDNISNVIGDTFKNDLTSKFTSGKLSEITGLFGKSGSSSPFAVSLINNVVANLISKVGLPKELSSTIAKKAVPFVLDKFKDFASERGKDNEAGISDLLGGLLKGSVKDSLFKGIGKKFGF